jgi:hypothetical protein
MKFKSIIIRLSCIKETHVNLFPTSSTSSYVRVICACFCHNTSPSSRSTLPKVHINLKYNIIFGKWYNINWRQKHICVNVNSIICKIWTVLMYRTVHILHVTLFTFVYSYVLIFNVCFTVYQWCYILNICDPCVTYSLKMAIRYGQNMQPLCIDCYIHWKWIHMSCTNAVVSFPDAVWIFSSFITSINF